MLEESPGKRLASHLMPVNRAVTHTVAAAAVLVAALFLTVKPELNA